MLLKGDGIEHQRERRYSHVGVLVLILSDWYEHVEDDLWEATPLAPASVETFVEAAGESKYAIHVWRYKLCGCII